MLNQLRSIINTPLLKLTAIVVILIIILQCVISFYNLFLHLPTEGGRSIASTVATEALKAESKHLSKMEFIEFVEKLNQSRISVRGHRIHYVMTSSPHCSGQHRPNTIIKLKRKTCKTFKYDDKLYVNVYTELPRVISSAVTFPMVISLFIFIIILFYVFYVIRIFTFSIQFSRCLAKFDFNNQYVDNATLREDHLTSQIRHVIVRSINKIATAQKARAKILANTLHDLRSPLHRIKLRMQLKQDELDQKDDQDFKEIELITSTLLLYGKDDWLFNEAIEPVTINHLLDEIYTDYKSLNKKITLHTPKSNINIQGKKNALKRAITNIINNAYQHGSEVAIKCKVKADFIKIVIQDNGPGIPEGKMQAVFESYTSLKGTTGIGLTIAKEIIEYHQGEVSLENSKRGLDVEIKLPL
jgi:signal transduction histidine kinase